VTLADPRFATDATFTSGTDDTLANKIAPSTGLHAQGFDRDQPIPITVLNYILANHGAHLHAIADAPSFNWDWQPVYVSGELSSDATGNRNEPASPPLVYAAGERWIVKTVGGGTGICFHSWLNGRGNTFAADGDTSLFVASTDSGAGATATLLTGAATNRIVAMSSAGVARYTDDYGATWSAGGTANNTAAQPSSGGFYRGNRWVEVHTSAATTYVSYSEALSGTWTTGGTYVATDSVLFRRMISAGNTAVFLPDVCPTATQFLVDTGSGFGFVSVMGASSGWRGCYHDILGKFFATNLAGQLWSSTTGAAWALEGTLGSGAYDVIPHGRGLIVSTETEDFTGAATFARLTYVTFEPTLTERRMPWSSPSQLYPRFHLIRHRGRGVAVRMNIPSAQTERLEYWMSHVHPVHLAASTGL
jgi:hypothetical protein